MFGLILCSISVAKQGKFCDNFPLYFPEVI